MVLSRNHERALNRHRADFVKNLQLTDTMLNVLRSSDALTGEMANMVMVNNLVILLSANDLMLRLSHHCYQENLKNVCYYNNSCNMG